MASSWLCSLCRPCISSTTVWYAHCGKGGGVTTPLSLCLTWLVAPLGLSEGQRLECRVLCWVGGLLVSTVSDKDRCRTSSFAHTRVAYPTEIRVKNCMRCTLPLWDPAIVRAS